MFVFLLIGVWNGLGNVIWQVNNDNMAEYWSAASPIVIPNGHLYVRDWQSDKITHLDQNGKVLNVFGGRGNGPGEFINLTDHTFWPKSQQIVAFDPQKMALVFFDTEGTYIKSLPVWRGFTSSSHWLESYRVAYDAKAWQRNRAEGGARLSLADVIADTNTYPEEPSEKTVLLSLSEEEHEPMKIVNRDGAAMRFPWQATKIMVASPDHQFLVAGSTLNLNLKLFDTQRGNMIGQIVRVLQRQPVRDDDPEVINTSMTVKGRTYTAKDFNHKEYWPAIQSIKIDADNRIWVHHIDADRETDRFLVFTMKADPSGSLEIPREWTWVHADHNFVWLLGRNSETDSYLLRKQAYTLD